MTEKSRIPIGWSPLCQEVDADGKRRGLWLSSLEDAEATGEIWEQGSTDIQKMWDFWAAEYPRFTDFHHLLAEIEQDALDSSAEPAVRETRFHATGARKAYDDALSGSNDQKTLSMLSHEMFRLGICCALSRLAPFDVPLKKKLEGQLEAKRLRAARIQREAKEDQQNFEEVEALRKAEPTWNDITRFTKVAEDLDRLGTRAPYKGIPSPFVVRDSVRRVEDMAVYNAVERLRQEHPGLKDAPDDKDVESSLYHLAAVERKMRKPKRKPLWRAAEAAVVRANRQLEKEAR
jgi:hypothetical protein